MMLADVEQFISGPTTTPLVSERLAEIKRRRRQIPLPVRHPASEALTLKLVH
jgi:hypothetical protein